MDTYIGVVSSYVWFENIQPYMCLKKIGLCDQNQITIIESIANTIKGT